MSIVLTLDASVVVAACRPQEVGHRAAAKLLAAVRAVGSPLVEPAVLPVEVAAALSRTGTEAGLARDYALALLGLPRFTLVAVDERLARQATDLAARHRLRGADALYVAVALLYGSSLVSLDREQLQRAPPGLTVWRPEEACASLAG